jgi:TPR repeat protein
MAIIIKTSLLLLAMLYFLGTSSFAASNPFDDASAAYERGDYVQAMKLFRQLAEHGHQWAQRRLGLMYAEGKGVPQDFVRAYMWFNLAAAALSGDSGDTAKKNRDRIAAKMTAEQISTAEEMARRCQESKLKNCD